jgi:hypothetical protein
LPPTKEDIAELNRAALFGTLFSLEEAWEASKGALWVGAPRCCWINTFQRARSGSWAERVKKVVRGLGFQAAREFGAYCEPARNSPLGAEGKNIREIPPDFYNYGLSKGRQRRGLVPPPINPGFTAATYFFCWDGGRKKSASGQIE